jgi:hypothetical protein
MRLSIFCLVLLSSSQVFAGPALDEGGDKSATAPTGDPAVAADATTTPVEYGVGIRLRNVRIPKGEIELFLERAGDSGSSTTGLGVDLIRRRGNVELQLGFEYERIKAGEGTWIESGKDVAAGDAADWVPPDNGGLGWFTLEFTFLNHAKINKYVSVRYGGGAGLGIVTGSLKHYNVFCAGGASNDNPEPGCIPNDPRFMGQAICEENANCSQVEPVKYNLPPVFPVVNAIIGVQFKPIEKMTINLEGGIRTFLFIGTSAAYFF